MKTPIEVAKRAYTVLRGTFALVGIAALSGVLLLPAQSALIVDELDAPSATGPIQVLAAESPSEREQRAVTEYIAKRYRVAETAVGQFVSLAYQAGEQHRVDPLLILAVMAIESRYNPVAESTVGAKGLMQVIPKYHPEKLLDHGGEHAVLEPAVNIQVGAQILREYSRRFGDVETALQMYAGALDEPTTQYANKVFAEKARLDALRVRTRKLQTAQAA
jgi:soluble lytic murein transglycosylase-like protein